MALRLVRSADDFASRVALARYFLANGVRRALRRSNATHLGQQPLNFRLQGAEWEVQTESAHMGGIHDVWLAKEYDAFPGFRAGEGSVVVDIGANIGAYALWQYRNMGGHGRIVAAEASPNTYEVLRQNVLLNRAEGVIECVALAIWRERGEVEFLASRRHSSTSGIAETADLKLLEQPTSLRIHAVTLQDLLKGTGLGDQVVDVLKVDVEGAELEIMRAAAADAMPRVRRIVVEADEVSWPSVLSLLQGIGFTCVGRHRTVGYFATTMT